MIKNRIQYYLELTGKTQSELSNFVGASKQAVSQWANNEANPKRKRFLEKICEFFNPHLSNKIREKHLFYIE